MVSIAVSSFFPHNKGIAKWAWFGKKSFHTYSVCQA
jgi:hypothetical protein